MNKIILSIIVAVLAGLAIIWLVSGDDNLAGSPSPSPTVIVSATVSPTATLTVSPTTTATPAASVTIRYTASGYQPTTVTVKSGTKVVFANESGDLMWTASAVHPTHNLLPGFDAKAGIVNGGAYAFTFTKPGTWSFHNHLKPNFTGKVIVE